MKVVINGCYGGFSLSHEAILRYAEIKGVTVYPEQGQFSFRFSFYTYWTVPPGEQRAATKKAQAAFYSLSMEERQAANKAYDALTLDIGRTSDRADPILVQVVEEMGERANGAHAALRIIEIPDNVQWEIDEYAGLERVAEKHRTWS